MRAKTRCKLREAWGFIAHYLFIFNREAMKLYTDVENQK